MRDAIYLLSRFRLVSIAAALLSPAPVLAYRPFESTDADVTDADELEIELGYIAFERDRGDNTVTIPQFVLNYGLTDTLELVGEFEGVWPEHQSGEIEDVGLFLKKLMRRGVLQDDTGLSIAIEGGLLVPAHNGEDVGLEAIGIVSGQVGKATYHVNFGGGLDRIDSEQFGLWGAIVEYPLNSRFRIAGEVASEKVHDEPKESSVLIGFIYESPATGNAFDAGLRRGITSAAADWELSLGWTFAFAGTSNTPRRNPR